MSPFSFPPLDWNVDDEANDIFWRTCLTKAINGPGHVFFSLSFFRFIFQEQPYSLFNSHALLECRLWKICHHRLCTWHVDWKHIFYSALVLLSTILRESIRISFCSLCFVSHKWFHLYAKFFALIAAVIRTSADTNRNNMCIAMMGWVLVVFLSSSSSCGGSQDTCEWRKTKEDVEACVEVDSGHGTYVRRRCAFWYNYVRSELLVPTNVFFFRCGSFCASWGMRAIGMWGAS